MVIGNVIGSNVANLSLVFDNAFMVALRKLKIQQDQSTQKNLLILLSSSVLVWVIIAINPFNFISSLVLLISLVLVICFGTKWNL